MKKNTVTIRAVWRDFGRSSLAALSTMFIHVRKRVAVFSKRMKNKRQKIDLPANIVGLVSRIALYTMRRADIYAHVVIGTVMR